MTDGTILMCAFRYALGRSTHVVHTIVREVHKQWDNLCDVDKALMTREIQDYKNKHGKIGHLCDESEWMSIVTRYDTPEQSDETL